MAGWCVLVRLVPRVGLRQWLRPLAEVYLVVLWLGLPVTLWLERGLVRG